MKKSTKIYAVYIVLIFCSCINNSLKDRGQIKFAQPRRINLNAPLNEQAKQAIKIATIFIRSISINGGYAGIYSKDLKEQWGESSRQRVKKDEIWIQPPGTPTVGLVFLRAYKTTKDIYYLEAAIDTARALAWSQSTPGGWEYLPKVMHMKKEVKKVERINRRCTFDDNTTQEAINFLICLDEIHDESWLTGSIELAMQFMLKSQFTNGAWPQWYPLRGGYHDYYTFNDGAINDCIRVMLKAHQVYKKEEYLKSAIKGGEFIIKSTVSKDQPGWAQQYSYNLKPVWARNFEPPSVCSKVTERNIKTLVNLYLYTKDMKFLKPISPAIKWLQKSKIGDNQWARMYEIGSNKPIYGDRDRKIHYILSEISKERQDGYSWQRDFEIPETIMYYNKVKKAGAEKYLEQQKNPVSPDEQRKEAVKNESTVKKIISTLDKNGYWVKNNKIYNTTFVSNVSELCRYLEYNK